MKPVLFGLCALLSLHCFAMNCQVRTPQGEVLSQSDEAELYDCELKCFSHAIYQAYAKPVQCFFEGQESTEFCTEEGDFSFSGLYRYVYPTPEGCLVRDF